MGVDFHGLCLLRLARKAQAFGRTATIGRQGIHLQSDLITKILELKEPVLKELFCENLLLRHFGASIVQSFDNSDFEAATFICDLNVPLERSERYDTIIDFGTLEHIYNVPQALKNVASICEIGGQILHVLPANNFSGHGFWQFSPELFYNLYKAENGFLETDVFVAELDDHSYWYRPQIPSGGERIEFSSKVPAYVLVRTKKVGELVSDNLQQSDYQHAWQAAPNEPDIIHRIRGIEAPSKSISGRFVAATKALEEHYPTTMWFLRKNKIRYDSRKNLLSKNKKFQKLLIKSVELTR